MTSMTSMVRVFLGSGDIIVFEPVTDDEEEVAEARIKSQYINYLVQKRPGAYKTVHDFLKDAEIQKMGVLHYYIDTTRDTREQMIEGVSVAEIAIAKDRLKDGDDKVKKVEIVAKEDKRAQLRRSKEKLAKRERCVELKNVPRNKVARIFGPSLDRFGGGCASPSCSF